MRYAWRRHLGLWGPKRGGRSQHTRSAALCGLGFELFGECEVEAELELGLARRVDAGESGLPFVLDVPEVPDGQGDGPGDNEESDDREADVVQVEVGGLGDRPAGDVELVGKD